MDILKLPLVVAAGLGLSLATVTAVPAAAQSTAPAQTAPQAAPADFSEDELRSFARAVVAVERVKADYRQQLEATPDTTQQEEIRGEAMTEMVQAVQSAGLSVEQYNDIYTAQQTDPALAERVETYVSEVQ